MPSLLLMIPLALIVLLNLFPRAVTRRLAFWVAAGAMLLQAGAALIPAIDLSPVTQGLPDSVFPLVGGPDALSRIVLLSIAIVGFAVLLTLRAVTADPVQRFKAVNLVLIALFGMDATAMASDLFTVYLFIEITAIASFILIGMEKKANALEGAFKYLILSAVASFLMLSGIGLTLLIAGDTGFASIASAFAASPQSLFVRIAICLFMGGALIKSGVVPFHGWLPDAYSASPTPVSVLLAGIVTKATGVYVVMRLSIALFGFAPELREALMALGLISILVGAFAAMAQRDFKRMLAYSSISQVGYIILGVGCATPLAIAGAAFHFFNHAIFKGLLFVNAAAVEKQAGTMELANMGGLASRMPVTGVSSAIAVLSTAGIPPLAGFWSKLVIIVALWNAGRFGFASAALVASIVTLGYFLILQRRAFFGRLRPGLEGVREAGAEIVVAEVLLSAITVGVGIAFPLVLQEVILPLGGLVK